MTVRLRPHHLLCLLTYAGKGYTPAFTANFDLISKRLSAGEDILVVHEPDDICAPLLLDGEPHCGREGVRARDEQAAEDVGRLLDITVSQGTRIELEPASIGRMRDGFADGRIRTACGGCEWFELCSAIASDGYSGAHLRSVDSSTH